MRTGFARLLAVVAVTTTLGSAGVVWAVPVVAPPAAQEAEPVLLSKAQFRDRMVAHIKGRFPAAKVVVESETALKIDGTAAGEHRMFLENAYRLYSADPASIETILTKFGGLAGGAGMEDKLAASDLRAIIRPGDFLDAFKAMKAEDDEPITADDEPLNRPFPGGLMLLIAQDHAESFSYPPRKDVLAVMPDEGEVWRRAVANLPAAVGELVVEDIQDGVLIVQSEGSLTSSLLLFDAAWSHRDLRRIKTPVVLLASREALLVVDAGNRQGVETMRRIAGNMAQDPESGLQSTALLIKRADRWEVLPD